LRGWPDSKRIVLPRLEEYLRENQEEVVSIDRVSEVETIFFWNLRLRVIHRRIQRIRLEILFCVKCLRELEIEVDLQFLLTFQWIRIVFLVKGWEGIFVSEGKVIRYLTSFVFPSFPVLLQLLFLIIGRS
jgi:hypothetical protein